MADSNAAGATSGDVDASKETTFTKADLDKAVKEAAEAAAKAARAEEYRKSQSLIDKARADAGKKAKELDELKRKQIAALPEEERTKAMIEDLYARLSDPKATDDDSDDKKTDNPSPSVAETAQQAQARMREIAKAQGLDPAKLDFTSEEAFFKSIISQGKKNETEPDPNGGPVDTGNHTVGKGSRDLTKITPESLINNARKNWKPIRGRQR